MSDRGVHPDLLEEEVETPRASEAEGSPPPQEAQPRGRGRARTRSAQPPEATVDSPGETVVDGTPEADGAASNAPSAEGPPAWMEDVRKAQAGPDALAIILKNVPLEELQKHPQISGWIGNMAQRTAREQAAQAAIEEAERSKRDAWQRGDYYRLGELSAPELEQRALQAQQQQATEPFMQSLTEYQKTLPDQVQAEIQGKNYSSVADYMQSATEAKVRYDLEQEIKKRQPALTKAQLSATVGAEQSPERDGGPSPGTREITDAEVDAMSLEQYEQYFDRNGHPRNGVRLRLTRGIDVSRR